MNEDVRKTTIVQGTLFVISVVLLALCYNLFLLPNNLIIGGVSGLAILFQDIFKINSQIFIYVSTFVLVTLSYFTLGKEKTKNTIIGAVLYPVMVTLTEPIAEVLLPYFTFDDFWIPALLSALIFGFSSGMVFRYNFSTGGSDIMISIFSKYFKFPEGQSMFLLNILIIIFGGFVFGLELMIYALIVLYISSLVLDKVMFDISNSKVFYIFTRKDKLVEKIILEEFKTGFTVLPTKGGYSHINGTVLMAVLPNREYFHFKNRILEEDEKAFFIICDCYESLGGYKKKNIPYV